jgi:nitrite reductase (NADH) small subunit
MVQTPIKHETLQWVDICSIENIFPNMGVCALIEDIQVAIFRVETASGTQVYALNNYDPFSKVNVLSRGIVGDRKGVLKVVSPIYKQNFSLETGQCLDDESVKVPVYFARVLEGRVEVSLG